MCDVRCGKCVDGRRDVGVWYGVMCDGKGKGLWEGGWSVWERKGGGWRGLDLMDEWEKGGKALWDGPCALIKRLM